MNNTESFIQHFRAGDPQTLNILWQEHYKALTYFAHHILRNNLMPEDIVSDTFWKLWNLRDRFDNVKSIKAFLYVTVRNSCYDLLRSEEIHSRIHDEILYSSDYYVAEMNRDNYDLMYAEYIQTINVGIEKLPDRCRKVFQLYFFNRRSTNEIAELMKTSPQTVRNQKTKAVEFFRNFSS